MTPTEQQAARELVAAGMEWREGMRVEMASGRRKRICTIRAPDAYRMDDVWEHHPDDMWCPDLTDPATVGVLLGMLWERWPDVEVRLVGMGGQREPRVLSPRSRCGSFYADGIGLAIARALTVALETQR